MQQGVCAELVEKEHLVMVVREKILFNCIVEALLDGLDSSMGFGSIAEADLAEVR